MAAGVSFDDIRNEWLKDPEFAEEYEKTDAEFQIIRVILDARISQNLTEEDIAKRTGISLREIRELEFGTCDPTIELLQKLASGLDMHIELRFVPNE